MKIEVFDLLKKYDFQPHAWLPKAWGVKIKGGVGAMIQLVITADNRILSWECPEWKEIPWDAIDDYQFAHEPEPRP